jgi:hypothetical protein
MTNHTTVGKSRGGVNLWLISLLLTRFSRILDGTLLFFSLSIHIIHDHALILFTHLYLFLDTFSLHIIIKKFILSLLSLEIWD